METRIDSRPTIKKFVIDNVMSKEFDQAATECKGGKEPVQAAIEFNNRYYLKHNRVLPPEWLANEIARRAGRLCE